MYNLLEYSKNYSKTSGSLWIYYRDELTDETNDDNGPNKNVINSKSVCSYHVTYAFQSESTLYSCLNVKELLARSRREILKFK